MTEQTTAQKNKQILLALLFGIAAITIYRILMISGYLSRYIDDDQALMWYGTVLASHGGIREPHFLGQMYGSMLESILAVPFYKAGVPLEWALPLTTFLIWFFPFVLCAMHCRKKQPAVSFCILLCAILCHWDYDMMTNIPRSFIAGFPFAFLGVWLMTSRQNQKPWKSFWGIIFMGLAYLNTVTSIAVSALGILYLLLYDPSRFKRHWMAFLSGGVIVLVMLYCCNHLFYQLNPDYWVFGSAESVELSWDIFQSNLLQLGKILWSFSIVNILGFPFSFVVYALIAAVWFGLLLKRKDYRFLVVIICAIIGSILFMAIRRTKLYDDTLFYSPTRLYLYFPYVVITVLYLFACKDRTTQPDEIRLPVFKKQPVPVKKLCMAFLVIISACSLYKIGRFEVRVITYPLMYQISDRVGMCAVEDIYRLADEMSEFARENDTDIIISINHEVKQGKVEPSHLNKCVDYATSAINYDQYTEYRSFFDRRTDVYLKLKQRILHHEKVGFVQIVRNQIGESYTVVLDDTDCISYLE